MEKEKDYCSDQELKDELIKLIKKNNPKISEKMIEDAIETCCSGKIDRTFSGKVLNSVAECAEYIAKQKFLALDPSVGKSS